MKLYEVQATEYNGEQEYAQSKLLVARNIDEAWDSAREYFEKWYEDGDDKHADPDDPNRFEFIGGCIILEIDSITETTLEHWKQQQVHLHSIGKLPRTKSAHKKCRALRAVCRYIRDCLDVGGEQSRQFADEIAYLNRAIKESKL
jgi:hypothetical protein